MFTNVNRAFTGKTCEEYQVFQIQAENGGVRRAPPREMFKIFKCGPATAHRLAARGKFKKFKRGPPCRGPQNNLNLDRSGLPRPQDRPRGLSIGGIDRQGGADLGFYSPLAWLWGPTTAACRTDARAPRVAG